MHPRQEIRNAIADRLKEVNTKAVDRIYVSRAKPLFDQNLPAILVYANDEQIHKERWDTDGFGPLERNLEISIEAVDCGKDDLDDKLDEIAMEIENAMDGWEIPNRKSAILKFKGTDMDMTIDGKKTYGAIRLTFGLSYRTETKQPEVGVSIPTEIIINQNITPKEV